MMDNYTAEELEDTLQVVSSVIGRCEKMQPKFAQGTSQHTLLRNRLKALYISKSLLKNESATGNYAKEELMEALRPISSIISKCEKAQQKFEEGASHHTRFQNILKAMNISKLLITEEIRKRG